MTVREGCRGFVQRAVDEHGRVDVLIDIPETAVTWCLSAGALFSEAGTHALSGDWTPPPPSPDDPDWNAS